MVIMNTLQAFWRKEHTKRGYVEIKTPMILDRSLWLQSGHWDHYKENMYFTEIDEAPFAVKPMNCPGGILVYKNDIHSYRELPLRMAELGFVHRHERSGALHGLMRVRAFTQDDAHIYCTPEQIKDEIKAIMELDRYFYQDVFGFKYYVELSTRPEDSMGDPKLWDLAEQCLKEALEETGTPYKLNPGDGAFYGPKIDFHLEDCIGRTWPVSYTHLNPEFDTSHGKKFRGERLWALLEAKRGDITLDYIKECLRDHQGYPESVCSHPHSGTGSTDPYKMWQTVASLIYDLDSLTMDLCCCNPCENEYSQIRLADIK